jgi:hypothetical protein
MEEVFFSETLALTRELHGANTQKNINPLKPRERERASFFVKRFPGYARSSFW